MDEKSWRKLVLIGRIMLLITILLAAGCTVPTQTSTEPSGTVGPTPIIETAVQSTDTNLSPTVPPDTSTSPTVPVEPTPSPSVPLVLPVFRLPDQAAQNLEDVANNQGLEFVDLARDNTVIYANNDLANSSGTGLGAAYLLTPSFISIDISTDALASEPGAIENQMLGGLTVVEQMHSSLPVDDYVITLDEGDDLQPVVRFTGANNSAEFPGVIRQMPFPVPRPVALITAVQMCLTWNNLQICALVDTPPQTWILNRIQTAVVNLGASPEDYVLQLTVPDIEGVDALNRCAEALLSDPPDYSKCLANVLAAPSVDDLPPPPDRPSGEYHLGVMAALEPIQEEVYLEPELLNLIGVLASGDYRIIEIILDTDPVAPTERALLTRVGFINPSGEGVYLPSVSRGTIVGQEVGGAGPQDGTEAIITNLWVRGCCFFKDWQCSWLVTN